MKLAKIENDEVIKYPYTITDYKNENPNISLSKSFKLEDEENIIIINEKPLPDYFYTDVVLKNINGIWEEVYEDNRASEEIEKMSKEYLIEESMHYLHSTDWVITKINEEKILENDVSSLIEKYADIIEKRKFYRIQLNELGV